MQGVYHQPYHGKRASLGDRVIMDRALGSFGGSRSSQSKHNAFIAVCGKLSGSLGQASFRFRGLGSGLGKRVLNTSKREDFATACSQATWLSRV